MDVQCFGACVCVCVRRVCEIVCLLLCTSAGRAVE